MKTRLVPPLAKHCQDLNAERTHLPVCVDPSQAAGSRSLAALIEELG